MESPALDAPGGLAMRRVATPEDWAEVRGLRYRALAARDDIEPRNDPGHGDEFDVAFNTETFVLSHEGRAIASTRTSAASTHRRWPLPASEAYRAAIAALGADATLVEASLTVVDPLAGLDWKAVLFHLFKAHMLECSLQRADWLLVAVRESQIGFYRRMFNMEILSGTEKYPGLASPRVLMGLDYAAQAALLSKRIPMLAVSGEDERDFAQTGCILFGKRRGSNGGGEGQRAGFGR
jgi:hypothetical protein